MISPLVTPCKYKKILTLFWLIGTSLSAQQERSVKMGQTTLRELNLKVYKQDSAANALVLYEHANYYKNKAKGFKFTTDYYHRIKIFNKEGLKHATVNIYANKEREEIVSDIKAITYNTNDKKTIETTPLKGDDLFLMDETEKYTKTSFTLPSVRAGSVIEYSYSISTHYLEIKDWYFQSDIPKIKSELDLAILGNYKYYIKLSGFLELDKEESYVKYGCLEMPNKQVADCAAHSYGMTFIPAFVREDYMLSDKNYRSKISFDLESITKLIQYNVGGKGEVVKKKVENYLKTWKDADRTLRLNFLNKQGDKKGFFKKKIPKDFFEETDVLEKAKKVYAYIQNHFGWNGKNWISSDIKLKESFEEKMGSVDQINLSLYNSLQALNIESYITLVSTRKNGIPTKLFPAINDFNYIIVKAVINNRAYFLDATDKLMPFGSIPFKCLNGEGRVLDFEKGSYWQNVTSKTVNTKKINALLKFNSEGFFESEFKNQYTGYFAHNARQDYFSIGRETYLENLETKLIDSEIENHSMNLGDQLEDPVEESFNLLSDTPLTNEAKISIKPIILDRSEINPFKLKERLYPVDFGYRNTVMQRIHIVIPQGYLVKKLPEATAFKLPNNGGSYVFKIQHKNNEIKVFSKYALSRTLFSSEEYFDLKAFFSKIIAIENSEVLLEKI